MRSASQVSAHTPPLKIYERRFPKQVFAALSSSCNDGLDKCLAREMKAALIVGATIVAAAVLYHHRRRQLLSRLVRAGRKAVCVGKNYRDHITELVQLGPSWKAEEEPEPVLFLKPTTSYAFPGTQLVLPPRRTGTRFPVRNGIHHELELAVIIGKTVKDVSEGDAMGAVAGYMLALDITERDEQTAAKDKGMPWTVSKSYDTFLPLSDPFELEAGEDWRTLRMWLDVNGQRRQACEAGAMIHSVPSLIAFISRIMTLEPGDLIVTGTPFGRGEPRAGRSNHGRNRRSR